ncbi:VWD domain-containing protein [Phytohabitans houttuyneae]
MAPKPGPTPLTVGRESHVVAERPRTGIGCPPNGCGPITRASGSFENVTEVVGVSSPITRAGEPVRNAYTLQLNTNYFPTTAESCQTHPGCQGWQQFVLANDGAQAYVYIQYWLRNYNAECPDGWDEHYPFPGDVTAISCYQNTAAVPAANMPITAMETFELIGIENGNPILDSAMFRYDTQGTPPETKLLRVTAGSTVNPGQEWRQAEFNVFGYGNGSDAIFNPDNPDNPGHADYHDADMHVRTQINYGGLSKPRCVNGGFSDEANNLNFVASKPAATGTAPAILVHQGSTGGIALNGCDVAAIIGDTHQYTSAGLAYDFQATGDFIEAQVGTMFEVQTRKANTPSWANASVNRSVGVRMSGSRVTVCDGSRLVVNGTTTGLASGASLRLPTGVNIERVDNSYTVSDPSGNGVRITGYGSHTDVKVGIADRSAAVRGLLGNPDNDPTRLEAKDGRQFTVPVPFNLLYGVFGNSWRVSPSASLLQPCTTVAAANPSSPFYAGHLPSQIRQRAQDLCNARGTAQGWLDACVLDVVVLGDHAVGVYTDQPEPAVLGNPPQPPIPCSGSGPCPRNGPVQPR